MSHILVMAQKIITRKPRKLAKYLNIKLRPDKKGMNPFEY